MSKKSENKSEEFSRFEALATKLVAVPKKEIDRRIELERQEKEEEKDKRKKA